MQKINKSKKEEKIIVKVFIRVCESPWHEEKVLNKHQECDICHSKAYHLVKLIKNKNNENL